MQDRFFTLSEYFDIFMNPAKAVDNTRLRTYQDPAGNKAEQITTYNPDGSVKSVAYRINGRPVKTLTDEVLECLEDEASPDYGSAETRTTLPEPLIKGSEELNLNMSITGSGDLKIVANLAGVETEQIEVSFSGVYLSISVHKGAEASDTEQYIVRGLKELKDCKKQIYIDESKFSIRDLNYEYANGLLVVNIPKNESKDSTIVFKPKPVKGRQRTNKQVTDETV